MINDDNSVKRMDLNLRLEYLGLKTEIYKVSEWRYAIYCEDYVCDFSRMKEKFDKEIRIMGTAVELVNQRPNQYQVKLDNISFDNTVYGFKASTVTETELDNFIRAMFPRVDIVQIITRPGINFSVTIEVSEKTDKDTMLIIKETLLSRDIGTDDIIVKYANKVKTEDESFKLTGNIVIDSFLQSQKAIQLRMNDKCMWQIDESEYWFENAEKIYEGNIKRENIPYYRHGQKNCFLDFSVFDNIDIRKVLLLYDTIYLGVPIEDNLNKFLRMQRMNKKELVELVAMGKVVLVLTNDENRYDKELLDTVYRECPLGVIGRRAVNTLIASYISELNSRYLNNFPKINEVAIELYEYGILKEEKKFLTMSEVLMWPIKAKAKSFIYLNNYGIMTLSNYGTNKLYDMMLAEMKNKEAIQFEFDMNAYPIHLALSLNATYFPYRQKEDGSNRIYSDYFVSKAMETLLSMYWYDMNQLKEIKSQRNLIGTEHIEFFDCSPDLSALHVARKSDELNTPDRFGELLLKLGKLSESDRNESIRNYNNLLFEISEMKEKKSVMEWIMTGVGFVPMNDKLSFAINIFQILADKVNSYDTIIERHEKNDLSKKINKITENSIISKDTVDDIYLLDKIHRVAQLTTRTE